ncbi:PTO1314 family radical SAM protein [Acidianus brierleyi]|uniref:PTO1314 family radical SAM protein n=1 Tax=Acidianus brierleyi TaxID=41673 RepID=A0A2U9IBJ9_9CREN|nr:PTO1314 family radical SAM protein [Acidianus brierleyi]AWR93389.1 PTO1314 family radical SAM protein [Acidianus brierleyi]
MTLSKVFNIKPFIIQGTYRLLKSNKKLPLIAGHKLLYSCNLRCKMCPFWRRKDEKLLDLNDEIKMMKKLADAGVIFMGFEGGEPLLRRDLPEILKESHDRFHTSLVTNGILLKNKIDSIKKNLDFLFVSIDGIGEVHDSIRGVEGAFEKSLEGIKVASQYVPTDISFTITSENMNEAVKIVKLAEDLNVSVNFQVAYNYSTADKLSPDFIELRSILEQLLELKKSGAPITNSREYFESIINSWYRKIPWECKPWLTINIDPQGRVVLPCYVLNEYNGSVYVWDTDIEDLWEKYEWDKYYSCNKCGLSCYLEPSLFSWSNPSMVKERIIDGIISLMTR